MTTTIQPTRAKTTATKGVPMDSLRKTALVAGVLYVITFVSIPTLVLYGAVRRSELHRRPRPGHTPSSSAASWR